jgi:hypothetical protein
LKKVLRVVYGVLLILCGVAITLIGFWWEINLGVSISSQTPVNPNDAFSTYLTFTNNSHFVLTNLRYGYSIYIWDVINGKDADNTTIAVAGGVYDIPGHLLQGHSDTEKPEISIISPDINATMTVSIYYTPKFGFIPLPSRHDSFSFQSVTTPSGYAWIEKDVIKIYP